MNKYLKTLFVISSVSALCSCQSMKLKEGENKIRLGEYKVLINSPIDYLMISLSDEDFEHYKEYLKNDSVCNEKAYFGLNYSGAAHDEFENNDVFDLTKWYFAIGVSPEDGTMLEGTKTYFEDYESLKKRVAWCDFYVSIDPKYKDVDIAISLSDILYPECNAASAIVAGEDGYQELNSLGDGLTDGVLIKSLKNGEIKKITVLLYVDGNDPFVTSNNLDYLKEHSGKISFTLSVTENDSYNTSDEINSL